MALPVCQFVDRVGSGAVQRLNLNDDKKLTLLAGPDQRPGPDFSPPALKRAVVNTLLVEGATIPASAYDLRIIRLPLRVKACDEEEMAEILETLHRELDRGNNILKWHPTYNSRPVYFRTFRSPDYRLDQTMEGRGELNATLTILAEPFAYGDYVEQTGTIYNDPAAVANGIHFEIAAVEGDVPTPLYLYLNNIGVGAEDFVLATRRHGTPILYWQQCESMVGGTDTLIQANDPLMSGAGQNYMKTSFATASDWRVRLTWANAPAAGNSVEYRGVYRVFVRVRTIGTGTFNIYWQIQEGGLVGETVAVPNSPNIQMIDMGLLKLPPNTDPVHDGYTGIILPISPITFRLWAERPTGTGSLDWDYVVLIPADEEFAIGSFVAVTGGSVFDGPNDETWHGIPTLVASYYLGSSRVGSIPLVTPNQTNLYPVLRQLDNNVLADATPFTARYWPRYLYIR